MTRIGSKRKLVTRYSIYYISLSLLFSGLWLFGLGEQWLLFGLFFAMNLSAFLLMALDKAKAGGPQVRLPESFFYLISLFGASIGVVVGINLLRHKSRKESFLAVISAIMLLQVVAIIYLLMQLSQI